MSTPFPVGNINVYFIEGVIPTLIDTPPKGNIYTNELRAALKKKGYSIRDIKRIIITHPHFDHFGAAAEIVRLSKAEVWVSRGGGQYLEDFDAELLRDLEYYTEILKWIVAPGDHRTYLDFLYTWGRMYGCSVPVSRLLNDGDEIELGSIPFIVRAVPGHTPWCIMLYSQDHLSAFTGDFLLNQISSNALIQRPSTMLQGYKSLKVYLASLHKVKQMAIQTALPGHGAIILDVAGRIDEITHFIQQRKELVRNILDQGPLRPFSIVKTLFPDLLQDQLFLGISEVIGHLELLESEGSALQVDEGYWVGL